MRKSLYLLEFFLFVGLNIENKFIETEYICIHSLDF